MNSRGSETREKFAFRLSIIYHEAILLWRKIFFIHIAFGWDAGRRERRMAEISRHMISYSGAICHNNAFREFYVYSYDASTFKWYTKEKNKEKVISGRIRKLRSESILASLEKLNGLVWAPMVLLWPDKNYSLLS